MAKLYIVGTPIGNLKDITLRALETLKKVEVIACEDTRHSLTLLSQYDIHAKLIAYHKFNESECSARLIEMLKGGTDIALITDAGMPSISDPGAEIISRCREEGISLELVPGPTALASAVSLSGIKSSGFTFLGFLPDKTTDKVSILTKHASSDLPLIFYVAPHDLTKTATLMFETIGDRTVHIVRELTKIHESVTTCTLSNFSCEERGEMVLIVEPSEQTNPLLSLPISDHLRHHIANGMDKKDAIKAVSKERSIPKNEVYQIALTLDD